MKIIKSIPAILFLFAVSVTLHAQKKITFTVDQLTAAQGGDVKDFNLEHYITADFFQNPGIAFSQSNLTEFQTEERIKQLIFQQIDKPLDEIEVPINYHKLRYLGFVDPQSILKGGHSTDPILTLSSNIYQYENLYISTSRNGLIDRYLIYYVIRAYVLLQYKYPYIFQTLFKNTAEIPYKDIAAAQSQGMPVSYANTTNYIYVSLDNPQIFPTTFSKLGPFEVKYFGPLTNLQIYSNVHIIKLNRTTIMSGGAGGTQTIYHQFKNGIYPFQEYMLDGFLNTFAHERIHDMILEFENLSRSFSFIRADCEKQHLVDNYYRFEELLVNNTTKRLFEWSVRNGLSADFLDFFHKDDAITIAKLKTDNFYNGLRNKIIEDNRIAAGVSDDNIFLIDLENKTIGINGNLALQAWQQRIRQIDEQLQNTQNLAEAERQRQQTQQQYQQMLEQQQQQMPDMLNQRGKLNNNYIQQQQQQQQ